MTQRFTVFETGKWPTKPERATIAAAHMSGQPVVTIRRNSEVATVEWVGMVYRDRQLKVGMMDAASFDRLRAILRTVDPSTGGLQTTVRRDRGRTVSLDADQLAAVLEVFAHADVAFEDSPQIDDPLEFVR